MRKIRWSAALAATALVVTACGGDDSTSSNTTAPSGTSAPNDTSAPSDTTAPSGECTGDQIELVTFTNSVGQGKELEDAAYQRFTAQNPCITVKQIETANQVEDLLSTYLQLFEAQSSEADVFQIDVIWPGDLADQFVDLNEYGAAEPASQHFPAIVENNTVDGKLVGIPWYTDGGLLYYRTDLLEKYNLEPPTTWDELETAAQTIQDGERADNPDFWGYVWQGDSYEGLTCDALEWVKSSGGGQIIEPDGTITINNQAAIDIVDKAAGWVGTISPPGVTAYAEEDARGVWQAGNAAFMRNWPYAYSLGNGDDSEIVGMFDVSPLPGGTAGETAATLGGWQLAVSKYSEHPEEAAKLALFMASPEEQKIRAIEGSYNPTIPALYEDADVLAAAPFFGSLLDVFTGAVARPSTITAPNYASTSSSFFTAVHSVLTGDKSAADAFASLELDYEDAFPDFKVGTP